MRPLDIIRSKKRFEMFSEESKEKVLEINSFFGKYVMHFEEKVKKTFMYYDTPNLDLLKSGIILYKTVIGNFCELNMANDTLPSTRAYRPRNSFKRFTISMKPHESLLKYKEFLIDSFTKMFITSINFDPEFLMRKLQVAYTIETISTEYRSMAISGLKITYSFDKDLYTNHLNNIKRPANILTIYQHTKEDTDEAFEDLISKLQRYCKELTPTSETKIMIARRMTSTDVANEKKDKTTTSKDNKDKKTTNKSKKTTNKK